MKRRRAAPAEPEVREAEEPKSVPVQPQGLGFEKWMGFLSNFIAPATLIAALLFYFGYVSSREFFRYFGVDVDVLSLTNQQFVMRSPGALFVPVMVIVLVAAGLIVAHRLLRRRVRGMNPERQRRVIRIFGWSGVALLTAGIVLAFLFAVIGDWDYYGFVTPLALAVGAGLSAYALSTARSLSGATEGRSAIVLLVAAVVAGTFWTTATVAQWWGLGQARILAADLRELPAAVLDSTQPLRPGTTDIMEVDLAPNAAAEDSDGLFRYRYHGLRLLVRGGDHLFLVPDEWSPNASTYVIPLDDEAFRVRFRFVPDADAPTEGSYGSGGQILLDHLDNRRIVGPGLRPKPVHGARRREHELLEVPPDAPAVPVGVLRLLQCLVQRCGLAAVHLDLLEDRKGHPPRGGAVVEDLVYRARLLTQELVARKSEHREAAIRVGALQLFELFVLGREPASGCNVDDEHDLFAVVAERSGVAVGGREGDVAQRGAGGFGHIPRLGSPADEPVRGSGTMAR